MNTLKTRPTSFQKNFTKTQFNAPPDQAQARPAPEKKFKTYSDLQIWKRGIDLVDMVYSATERFPKEEAEGLAVQMRRSAVLIPSDIAEGYVRRYAGEYTQFLYGALGACARLNTQLFISAKRNYLNAREIETLSAIIGEETAMLIGLIRAIQRNDNGPRRAQQESVQF